MATNTALMKMGGDTSLSLELPKNQTFEEWAEVGKNLANGNKVLNWWIGDWWAAGSHRYGERAKVAAEGIFGREFQTLRNLASVCRSFETSRRRDTLSFSHHAEVASLDPKQADELLERAERDSWTRNDIRAEAATLQKRAVTGNFSSGPQRALDYALSYLIGAWRRAPDSVKERFLGMLDGLEIIE